MRSLGAGLLTPGSSLPRPFPGRLGVPVVPSGSLPGHSGATAPVFHRLPCSAVPGSARSTSGLPANPCRSATREGTYLCDCGGMLPEPGSPGERCEAASGGLCSGAGTGRVRKLVGCFVVALAAAGCRDAAVATSPIAAPAELLIRDIERPVMQVSIGPVSALIPDDWRPRLAGPFDDPRQGLLAGPRPGAWGGDRPPIEGLAAMWVDGTQVGVPSDYYYLAATGPALDLITRSKECSATNERVIVDHLPSYAAGDPDSPGDFVARGQGMCSAGHQPTRWVYFVAAPGYGPVRELGIPTSSLYVVVAVMPDSPRAGFMLQRMLQRTEFGGSSVAELLDAAQPVISTVYGPT